MELCKEILINILKNEEINVLFPNLKLNIKEIVKIESYKTLQKIKAVIEDDSLSDFDCIEKIVCIFENFGSDGGNRHDF